MILLINYVYIFVPGILFYLSDNLVCIRIRRCGAGFMGIL